jgi:hypothetical protein
VKHRPTEIKAVAALLEQEHESVDVLAQQLLDLLVDIKWSRGGWIAIQRHRTTIQPDFTAWGPYATRGEAERDVGKRIVGVNVYETAYFAHVINKDVTGELHPDLED